LPPGLSFEVEIPETAEVSFAILVRVRDGDAVVPIAEVPEVAWPVAMRFLHEDADVEEARFELSPSSGGMRWTASAFLSEKGNWRSVLELRGLSEQAGSIEIGREVVQPPEPVMIRAGAATVARGGPEIDWGVVREIAEGEELLVWVRLDDRRQEWLGVSDTGFPIGEWVLEESLALEERPVLRMQSSYPAALGSVFAGEVELRASPSLDSDVLDETIDWVEAVGVDPSGEWILARPQLSTGIRFGWLEASIFGSAKESLPVALSPGVWLAESRVDGGLELASPDSVLHPGTAEWLPADSVIPCDSVVTSEFETADGLRLFTNGCGLIPGPDGALFARLDVSETRAVPGSCKDSSLLASLRCC